MNGEKNPIRTDFRPNEGLTSSRDSMAHLLNDEEIIGTTPTGLPLYRQDDSSDIYRRPSENRENNPLFLRQEEDVDKTALDAVFRRLTDKVAEKDNRDKYYFPKGSRISVQSSRKRRNGQHVVYYAITDERFFAIKARPEESKTGYEVLPDLGGKIWFTKKENIGAPSRISTTIAKNCKFYKPRGGKEGETYFNLSKAGALDDFNRFCSFILKNDRAFKTSRKNG